MYEYCLIFSVLPSPAETFKRPLPSLLRIILLVFGGSTFLRNIGTAHCHMLSSFVIRQHFQPTMCNMWPHRQYCLWLCLVKQLQELQTVQLNLFGQATSRTSNCATKLLCICGIVSVTWFIAQPSEHVLQNCFNLSSDSAEILIIWCLRRVISRPEVFSTSTSGLHIDSVTLSPVICIVYHWHILSPQAGYTLVTLQATSRSRQLFCAICRITVNSVSIVLWAACVTICSGYYSSFRWSKDE